MAYDRARHYTIEGKKLASVTTFLSVIDKSGPLMWWATKMEREAFQRAILDALTDKTVTRDKVLDAVIAHLDGARAHIKASADAATIGTAAHAMIEWRTKRLLGEKVAEEPVIPEAAQVAVMAWEDWCKAVDFTPLCAERVVHCLACGYAGTIDWIGKVRGVVTLGDYKTSKAIYPESFLQNRAYRHAANENGMPTEQGMVLRLPKTLEDPAFEAMVVPELPLDDVLAALRLWRWTRAMAGKLEYAGTGHADAVAV